jgi:hypothetical protein
MHSLKPKKTFMEIEISNDDFIDVTADQIIQFMAKCMNEPLNCNLQRASMQYDEAMDGLGRIFGRKVCHFNSGY